MRERKRMMMNKDMLLHQQQQQQKVVMEEKMSNLTSASGDPASVSSGNRTEALNPHHHQQQQQQYFVPQTQSQPSQPPKKKRNQPGNPDPEAEVIALSPKALLATNRFICEICGKGFQRDQNLQLHRRGHNLPWKLKQRANKDVVKKKVYVCPEASCVHHDPSRALGDLTGIKKHFCRKHGEKKWKCDKCSKRYAVQSDWKAHSKTCGTREYRCDCGTIFSRRDSFITHRAFCDALAEESARTIPTQPNNTNSSSHNIMNLHTPQSETRNHNSKFNDSGGNNNNSNKNNSSNTLFNGFPMKKEQQSEINYNTLSDLGHHHHHIIPPWLAPPPMPGHGPGPPPASQPQPHSSPPSVFPLQHELTASNSNPSGGGGGLFPLASAAAGASAAFHQPLLPPMSATALLQKAAQMGATMTAPSLTDQRTAMAPATVTSSLSGFGLAAGGNIHNPSLFQDYMINSTTGFDQGETFDETFGGFLRTNAGARGDKNGENRGGGGGGGVGEGLTRDFLGLRPLSHSDILSFASLGNCINSTTSEQQQHSHSTQKPWQG